MHAEVVEFVQSLAARDRRRFRASYVADQTSVAVDQVRRDLMDLVTIGDLVVNFEVISPESGETLKVFGAKEEIPASLSDEDGEPFEVSEGLIWVSFSPTSKLKDSASRSTAGGGPGKEPARQRAPWRSRTRSSNSWTTGPQGLSIVAQPSR